MCNLHTPKHMYYVYPTIRLTRQSNTSTIKIIILDSVCSLLVLEAVHKATRLLLCGVLNVYV